MYCMVADWHALTTMHEDARETSHNAREVAKDYIAAGLDPATPALAIANATGRVRGDILTALARPLISVVRVAPLRARRSLPTTARV